MVMGVSGCGKSTVGARYADEIGAVFLDGDDFHPERNIAHMVAGKPLTDDMRWPWLEHIGLAATEARQGQPVVFACSALRKSYRDHLRRAIPDLRTIYLETSRPILERRLSDRQDHFMPSSLLDSQIATLEEPQDCFASVAIDQSVDDIVTALKRLS